MFLAKIRKKYHNFSSENYHFYSREKLLYIARASFRKVLHVTCMMYIFAKIVEELFGIKERIIMQYIACIVRFVWQSVVDGYLSLSSCKEMVSDLLGSMLFVCDAFDHKAQSQK